MDDTEPALSKSALGNAATETIMVNDDVSPRFNDAHNRFKSGVMTALSKYQAPGSFTDQSLPERLLAQNKNTLNDSQGEDITHNVLSPE
jgi:hypothetical protein